MIPPPHTTLPTSGPIVAVRWRDVHVLAVGAWIRAQFQEHHAQGLDRGAPCLHRQMTPRPVPWRAMLAPPNDPPACPAWGWGQSVGVQSSPKNISASRESQLRRSTLHGLRLRGEIRSEGITDGKTAEATHQPDETVARSTEAHAASVISAISGIRR